MANLDLHSECLSALETKGKVGLGRCGGERKALRALLLPDRPKLRDFYAFHVIQEVAAKGLKDEELSSFSWALEHELKFLVLQMCRLGAPSDTNLRLRG